MIYFLTDRVFNNYTTHPEEYKPIILGKYVYAANMSWILFNNGMSNVKQTTTDEHLTSDDVLFFHYDLRETVLKSKNKSYKKVQILADRPFVDGCDLYAVYDLSLVDNKKNFYLDEPMPVGLRKCNPLWPPVVYGCIGRKSN